MKPETGAAPTTAAAAPLRIGKYELLALLSAGGMGAVYRALDPVLEREVALKVMLPDVARDPERRSRFEREARAVARLTHPYIVTLFDLGYHVDGSPYIVMELLKGRDLQHALRHEQLPLRRRLEIVLQVLEGLGHAHRLGIVHRDVKPANVFIVEDGTARIMDFGIARFGAQGATSCGAIFGTPSYMAPEQVLGGRVDGRADLWSVGALLCEVLTGRRPFDAATAVATLYRVVHHEPVVQLRAEDAAFLPVLLRALAKNPEQRFADAADFASALRACLGDATTPRAVPALQPAPDAPAADPSGIFELLRSVHVGRRSGHLHFAAGRERKSLRILRGQIVLGFSDAAGEHLGDVLVRYGVLSQTDRERAVTVVLRERKPLGVVLAEMKLLDRARLERAMGLHVREILFSVLERRGVRYAFEEAAESSVETDLRCPLSTGEVILEATRRVQDPAFVSAVLGDTSRVLSHAAEPVLAGGGEGLTPADAFLLSRVDGTLSAREVMSLVPLPPEDSERSLLGLLCTGAVRYASAAAPARRGPGASSHPIARVTPRTATPAQ